MWWSFWRICYKTILSASTKTRLRTKNVWHLRNSKIHSERIVTDYEYNNINLSYNKSNEYISRNDRNIFYDINKDSIKMDILLQQIPQPMSNKLVNISNDTSIYTMSYNESILINNNFFNHNTSVNILPDFLFINSKNEILNYNNFDKNYNSNAQDSFSFIALNMHGITTAKANIFEDILLEEEYKSIIFISEHHKNNIKLLPEMTNYATKEDLFLAAHKKFSEKLAGGCAFYIHLNEIDLWKNLHTHSSDDYIIIYNTKTRISCIGIYMPVDEDIYKDRINNTFHSLFYDIGLLRSLKYEVYFIGDGNGRFGNIVGDIDSNNLGLRLLELFDYYNMKIINSFLEKGTATFHRIWSEKNLLHLLNTKDQIYPLYGVSIIDIFAATIDTNVSCIQFNVAIKFLMTDHYKITGAIKLNDRQPPNYFMDKYFVPKYILSKRLNVEKIDNVCQAIANSLNFEEIKMKTMQKYDQNERNNINYNNKLCNTFFHTIEYLIHYNMIEEKCLHWKYLTREQYLFWNYKHGDSAILQLMKDIDVLIINTEVNHDELTDKLQKLLNQIDFNINRKTEKLLETLAMKHDDLKKNDYNFWKLIKALSPLKHKPIEVDDELVFNPILKITKIQNYAQNLFNNHESMDSKMQNKHKEERDNIIKRSFIDDHSAEFDNFVSKKRIQNFLKLKKVNKSSGFALYDYNILKHLNNMDPDILYNILSFIQETEVLPDKLTVNHTTLIPKKSNSYKLDNTRTIRVAHPLLSALEFCMNDVIYKNLHFNWCQFGGIKNISAYHAICTFINTVNYHVVNCLPLYAVLIDFCKAFDSVYHNKSIANLYYYGISGKTLRLADHILNNNGIMLSYEGIYTSTIIIERGTPQGSVPSVNIFNAVFDAIAQILINLEKGIMIPLKRKSTRNATKVYNQQFAAQNKNVLNELKYDRCWHWDEFDEDETFILLLILLYCDDGILFANNWDTLQYLTEKLAFHAKEYGLIISTKKSKILIVNKNDMDRNKELKLELENGCIAEIENGSIFTYLGIDFLLKHDKNLIIKQKDKALRSSKSIAIRLNNLGFNNHIRSLPMRKEIIKSIILPKITYGLIFSHFNKGDVMDLNRCTMNLMNSCLNTFRSTSHSALRILFGIQPTIASIYYMKLLFYHKFYNSPKEGELCLISVESDAILTYSKMDKIITKISSNIKIQNLADFAISFRDIEHDTLNEKYYKLGTFTAQIIFTLFKFNLQNYLNIDFVKRISYTSWKALVKRTISNYYFKSDKIKFMNNEEMLIKQINDFNNPHEYNDDMINYIQNNLILDREHNNTNTMIMRLLLGNTKANWRENKGICPICKKKVDGIFLKHILYKCENIKIKKKYSHLFTENENKIVKLSVLQNILHSINNENDKLNL